MSRCGAGGVTVEKFIVVTTQFEGLHAYVDAPEEVAFLATPHRHIFHIRAEIQVFHDNRELEFILVKRDLERFCSTFFNKKACGSCEMMAGAIAEYLASRYTVENKTYKRKVTVEVFEDKENGGKIVVTPIGGCDAIS